MSSLGPVGSKKFTETDPSSNAIFPIWIDCTDFNRLGKQRIGAIWIKNIELSIISINCSNIRKHLHLIQRVVVTRICSLLWEYYDLPCLSDVAGDDRYISDSFVYDPIYDIFSQHLRLFQIEITLSHQEKWLSFFLKSMVGCYRSIDIE